MAPETVISPARAQARRSPPGAPTSRADSADVMKMPEPIIAPMTSMVASSTPRSRCRAPAFAALGVGCVPAVVMGGHSLRGYPGAEPGPPGSIAVEDSVLFTDERLHVGEA